MRRLLPPAAAWLAAAALPLALAACSSGSTAAPAPGGAAATPSAAPPPANPDAGLLTGTQLKALLEPASYFPAGFTRDRAGTRDTGPGYQQPGTTGVAKPKCRLLGATSWTSITGINGVSFAQDAYIGKTGSAEIAQEIDVYRGMTAPAVMRKLGTIAAACPWYTDAQTGSRAAVSEKASPRLGDGYVITVTDPAWRNGSTLVAARVGTAVVTVLSTDGAGNGHASAMKLTSHLVAALRGRA